MTDVPAWHQPDTDTDTESGSGGGWLDRVVGSITPQEGEGFWSANPAKMALNVLGLPHAAVTSTAKELMDFGGGATAAGARVQIDSPSLTDWGRQMFTPSARIGVGDLLSMPDKVAGFDNPLKPERIAANPALRVASIAAGLVGDIGLDPLTYLGAPGARALSHGGRRQLAQTAAANRYVYGLELGVKRGDEVATRLSNEMHAASAKLNDTERAFRTATDPTVRETALAARDQATEAVDMLRRQTDDWLTQTGIGDELDRGIWNLAKPGGGAAELTDEELASVLLRTDDGQGITGLRLRPFWRTQGGMQLVDAETWAKWTQPLRDIRGGVGQTGAARKIRSHYGSTKNAAIIGLAEDTAQTGNTHLFRNKLAFLDDTQTSDNSVRRWREAESVKLRETMGATVWTEKQSSVLMDAIQTPLERWETDGIVDAMTRAGVQRDTVDGLRGLFRRWHQDGQAAGLEIGDLGSVYLPVRLAQFETDLDPALKRAASRAAFEKARWVGTTYLGQEIPTMHAMINAGVVKLGDDGVIKIVDAEKFQWGKFQKDLETIARETFGDAFNPQMYVKDPFRLADMYIGEMSRRLTARGYQAAARKNGLAVWNEEMQDALNLAKVTKQASKLEVKQGEVAQAYAAAGEQLASASHAWRDGPLYRREAEGLATQQQIIQSLKTFTDLVGRQRDPELRDAMGAVRNLTKVLGRKKGGAVLTRRQMDAANEFANLLEDADRASVLRGVGARRQAELLERAERQAGDVLARVAEPVASPAQVADQAVADLVSFGERMSAVAVRVSDELGAAVDGDDIDVALGGMEALSQEWVGFLDEFKMLRDRLSPESAELWRSELGAVEQMLLGYQRRVQETLDGVRADMVGAAPAPKPAASQGLELEPVSAPATGPEIAHRVRQAIAINSPERAAWNRLAELDPYAAMSHAPEAARSKFLIGDNGENLIELRNDIDADIAAMGATPELAAARTEIEAAIDMIEQAGHLARSLPMGDKQHAMELIMTSINATVATAHRLARDKAVAKAWKQNRKLRNIEGQLADMYQNMSQWADSAERVRYFQEEVSQKMVQWQDIHTSPEIGEMLETVMSPTKLPNMIKAWAGFNQWWRGWALLSVGYHTRNTVSSFVSNMIAGVDPKLQARTFMAYRRWVKNLPVEDKEMHDFISEAFEAGNLGRGQYGQEIAEIEKADTTWNPLAGIGAGLERNRGKRPTQFRAIYHNRQVGNHIENVVRAAAGFHAAQRAPQAGGAAARQSAARQMINRLHFDYADLSNLESNYIREVSLFYTWMSRNLVLQAEMAVARPQIALTTERLFNNVGAGAPFNPFAPEYFDENQYQQVTQNWYTTLELPYLASLKDVTKLGKFTSGFAGTVVGREGAREDMTRGLIEMAPMSREFMEFLNGRDALRGYPLSGSDQMKRLAGTAMPLYARVRRLVPQLLGGSEGERERVLSSWMGMLGVPFKELDYTSMRYGLREREQQLAADVAEGRNSEERERQLELKRQQQIERQNAQISQELATYR